MAQITITVAGRDYAVNCRDGEEPHLRKLGTLLDARAQEVKQAVGGVNEARQLLLAGLLMADELHSAAAPPAQAPEPAIADTLEKLADRIESVADTLEDRGANA